MSILQALSTIPFFVNINQGIDRTLALLEVKEKNATLKGQPVLIDCINLMLRSLTVLENELTAIATDTDTATDATDTAIATVTDTAIATVTDTAIATVTDTAIATVTDTAIATVTDTAIVTVTDTAIATVTDTAIVTVTDTAIATVTDTAIVTESTTVIDDDFQLVTFEEMTDYLFFQQSWKMIKDPSLAMKGQGYLSDRIDSSVWSFNKVLPVYYDKENKMIIVKSGLSFYGCIAGYLSIDELKWQFAHNLLHDLKHCNATESTDTAIATDTATTAIATATDTAIATDTATTAIATATDTAIATDTATTAIAKAVKTETDANRSLSKFQKLWYLQQIEYPEIQELKGIASINDAISSVSTFMAVYKAVTSHGIPEKDPGKKSAPDNSAIADNLVDPKKQQAFLLKQNTSDLNTFLVKCRINGIKYVEDGSAIGLNAYEKKKHFSRVILDNNLFDLFVNYKKEQTKKFDEQMAETIAFCKGQIDVDQIKPLTVDTNLPVATANTSDMESIPLVGSNGVSPEFKEFCDLKDRGIVSTTREYNELKLQEQSQNIMVVSVDFNGTKIINSPQPQPQPEKAEILSVNGIKVGGTIEIKKP